MTAAARVALPAAILLTLITGCSTTTRAGTESTPSASADVSALPPREAGNDDVGTAVSAAPAAPAVEAAETYIGVWARPGLDRNAWYKGVRPWVTDAYGQLLADTDPTHVPAHQVTGPARPVSSTTAVLVADVPTDAGPIRVTVVHTGGRWLVATAEPAPTP